MSKCEYGANFVNSLLNESQETTKLILLDSLLQEMMFVVVEKANKAKSIQFN